MNDKDPKEFRFGNDKFGGSYRPGEFEFKFPDELTREEFEEMFRERIESLHKLGREFMPFEEEVKTKKEKLKPLSIRVKAHTKEFFKNNSILSAREVLELYENFNNGSEAFINSLLEDEKQLQQQLAEIQEKLHNARLFKDKLNDLDLEPIKKTDDEIISSLEETYENSQIKMAESADDIIADIELYNTQSVVMPEANYLVINASNDIVPVVYYFSRDLAEDDVVDILAKVKKHCNGAEIENSFFEDDGE
ncbi:MAG: hypothetical protein IJ104_11145 [Methanobrevibacter sp.]|nr:hypothetical protein [Methanobrevibacter sp.]